jgi:solute carrier family 36 (proton-coupled amino acid transporter)
MKPAVAVAGAETRHDDIIVNGPPLGENCRGASHAACAPVQAPAQRDGDPDRCSPFQTAPMTTDAPRQPPSSPTGRRFPRVESGFFAEMATDVGNMLKAFIGLNFMYVSFAFSKAGLLRGVLGLIVITAVTEHCCLLLIKVKNVMPEPRHTDPSRPPPPPPSFADIGRFVGGAPMESAINAALVLTQFGYCVGYLIFISQTVHDLVRSNSRVWPFILVPLPPLLALAMLRSIRSLGPFSLLANAALLAGFVAVVVYIGKHFAWRPSSPPLTSFPLFFGQMTAALEGIGLVIPVESSMKNKARFPMVLRIALVMMTMVLMTVGILGFATFGDETRSILLLNFGTSPTVSAVKAVLVIGILFTYPLQLVPVIQITESWVLTGRRNRAESARELMELGTVNESDESMDSGEIMLEENGSAPAIPSSASEYTSVLHASQRQFVSDPALILLRFTIVIATAVTAMLAGASFGLFQALVGSLGASTLAYAAPSLFHVRVFRDELSVAERVKDWSIFAFGVIGSIVGTAVSLWEISKVHTGAAVSP